MKRIIASIIISIVLLATTALPLFAASDASETTASVTVGAIVSISLSDTDGDGIQFGTVIPSDTLVYGDVAQSENVSAILVTIEEETNLPVDINIKGAATTLPLENWRYSAGWIDTPTTSDVVSLESDYPPLPVYDEAVDGDYTFYMWVTVPDGTEAGTYTSTVYFIAQDDI